MTALDFRRRCQRPTSLVRPVPIDPSGQYGPTLGQTQTGTWRRTSHGLYVPRGVDDDVVEQRIVEQGERTPDDGAVTGWAALRWHGAVYFDGTTDGGRTREPVPLVVGASKVRSDSAVCVSQEQVGPREVVIVDGLAVTTVQRALFDEVRRTRDLRRAVTAIDMAAAARLISVLCFALYVYRRSGWTGVPFAREALMLAVNDSWSPMESAMRLTWVLDAGLPEPMCNVPVYDLAGRLVGIPDLLDPVAGLVGEYDGSHHKTREQHRQDVRRENDFRDCGLEYFAVVAGDRRRTVVDRMLRTRARAPFTPPAERRWTLGTPRGRRPPEELDDFLRRTGRVPSLVRM